MYLLLGARLEKLKNISFCNDEKDYSLDLE